MQLDCFLLQIGCGKLFANRENKKKEKNKIKIKTKSRGTN